VKIACLGWGSLIWEPKTLPVIGAWQKNGPTVRVEFLRQSGDGRITLVLDADGTSATSLWAYLECDDIDSAVAALQEREAPGQHKGIGRWAGNSPQPLITDLADWARENRFDAVVWTALGFRSKGYADRRSADEIIQCLQTLTGKTRSKAETYVRRAPKQINTVYRRRIEADLGWTPIDDD
jgi:hypothetical protein